MFERSIPISTIRQVWTKSTCFDSSNTSWRRTQMYPPISTIRKLCWQAGNCHSPRWQRLDIAASFWIPQPHCIRSFNRYSRYACSSGQLPGSCSKGCSWQCRSSTDLIGSMIDITQLVLRDCERSFWRLIICSRANIWPNWPKVSLAAPVQEHELIMLELITDLEQSKYQQSEWRLSIYGR